MVSAGSGKDVMVVWLTAMWSGWDESKGVMVGVVNCYVVGVG